MDSIMLALRQMAIGLMVLSIIALACLLGATIWDRIRQERFVDVVRATVILLLVAVGCYAIGWTIEVYLGFTF